MPEQFPSQEVTIEKVKAQLSQFIDDAETSGATLTPDQLDTIIENDDSFFGEDLCEDARENGDQVRVVPIKFTPEAEASLSRGDDRSVYKRFVVDEPPSTPEGRLIDAIWKANGKPTARLIAFADVKHADGTTDQQYVLKYSRAEWSDTKGLGSVVDDISLDGPLGAETSLGHDLDYETQQMDTADVLSMSDTEFAGHTDPDFYFADEIKEIIEAAQPQQF